MSVPPGALVDSRLGPGTLTIDTVDYSYQIANVALEPDISEEDGTPTLATPKPAPLASIAWKLTGSAIQDFEAGAAAFVNYLMDNALAEVPFVWTPNTDGQTSYAGTLQVRPVPIGGDAGVQITTDFELPVIGDPTRTDPVGTATASRRSSRSSSE
jgi:hypothetical protein